LPYHFAVMLAVVLARRRVSDWLVLALPVPVTWVLRVA
jgi:hypothetical protein